MRRCRILGLTSTVEEVLRPADVF